jgi:serine/threonine-protein kinase
MLSPSDKIKDYEVIAPLGSGGMATTYLARRRGVGGFSRLVTLKLVHKHLIEDENMVQLFLDEARISAHVAHPNVVHVEEVGQVGDSYFIAMEYVHGVSLAELLARLAERRLRLRPKFCVWLAAQIAEALHAAHEAKNDAGVPLDIVHRDVSPQNVLIGHTGHVKLIDFGIANSHSDTDATSTKRTVLGKLRYMSPEQLRLEAGDRRTDVYALGVMLWEMLAGRNLFRCQRYDDERDWAARENPPPPSRYSPHPMSLLDRAVLKAIACDPHKRWDNAFQFRAALLRADPAAARLDAPMVAGLMRSLLGDELDRRRASWPSEVRGELEPAPDVTTSQVWSLDELTADISGHANAGDDDEPANDVRVETHTRAKEERRAIQVDDDVIEDPTLAATPIALRGTHQTPGSLREASEAKRASARSTSSHPALSIPPLPPLQPHTSIPTTPGIGPFRAVQRIPTPVPEVLDDMFAAVPAAVLDGREAMLSVRSLRAATIGSVCLAFGVLIGTFLTPSAAAPQAQPAQATVPRTAAAVHAGPHVPMPVLPRPTETVRQSAREAEHDDGLTVRVDPRILADSRVDASGGASVNVNESGARESERRSDIAPTRGASATRHETRLGNRRTFARYAKGSRAAAVSSKRKASSRSHGSD